MGIGCSEMRLREKINKIVNDKEGKKKTKEESQLWCFTVL